MNGRRLTGRDYKRTRRASLSMDFSRLRDLAIGFGAGLCVAGVAYLAYHRATDIPVQAPPRPTPRSDPPAPEAQLPPPAGAEGKYDFYQMLPKFEVVVPEKERGTRVAPTAAVDRPGTYFLQVGSYRDQAVADRVHAKLAKLGIDSSVQRLQVDADVWHRVRIGPIKDLPRLNRLRQQLSASDLDSLVISVDE